MEQERILQKKADKEREEYLKEKLFYNSGLEDLLITAELGHLAKDQKKHKDEIRGIINGIAKWVEIEIDQACKEQRERIIEEIEKSLKDTDDSYSYGEGTKEGLMHSINIINKLKQ
jgi:hypothetical protein